MNASKIENRLANGGMSGVAFSLSLFFFRVGVKAAKQALK